MMRILHVTSSINPKYGGVSQAIVTTVEAFLDLGVRNEVLSLDSPYSHFLKDISFTVHALGPAFTPYRYSHRLFSWLRHNIGNYDKIIIHGLWQFHAFAAYTIWRNITKKKINLYVMPHGMLDPWFQKQNGRKWKALRNILFWHVIEKRIINNSDGLLFTCETERALARKSFGLYFPKAEKMVGLGIPSPPIFENSMLKAFLVHYKEPFEKYLLFMSRIHEKKGVDLIVEAYISLQLKGFCLPKLVIAGPGLDTVYGKKILKMASSTRNIIFTGMLAGEAKWGAFYGCDAFILPSHQENFGIVVAEALSCGKPVIITNQVNIWKEVKESGAGLVCDDTLEGVCSILLKWLELRDEERQHMRDEAYKAFLSNFFIKNNCIHFLDAIKH